ncbi:6994_t:CDS:2 [Paraglomus brasilianum]|uniref:6994_t:CDS:1 n=1 Tax=Paraglomus brasilianum TaxID=144538 RepID=A0A9N9A3S5_9GLOM|nr:6994_t:CDS:2 [Paraglomus brasilianum]
MPHPLQFKIHPSTGEDDDNHPLSVKQDTNVSTRSIPRSLSPPIHSPPAQSSTSFLTTLQSFVPRNKTFLRIFTGFHITLALLLYTLIFVDATLIHHQRESKALEAILQIINVFVVLCTLVNHPKRALNWENVSKAYEWYVYDGERAFVCSPARLTGILTLWNLGSLAQYGLSGILWFVHHNNRPLGVYLAFNVIALVCLVAPIPLVVFQAKRAKSARHLAVLDAKSRLMAGHRDMRSMEMADVEL